MKDSEPQIDFSELSPQQFQAAYLLAGGDTQASVASILQISEQTVSKWCRYDFAFRRALADMRAELWSEARERIKAGKSLALEKSIELLRSSDERIALIAAKLLFDLRDETHGSNPKPALQPKQTAEEQMEYLRSIGAFNGDKKKEVTEYEQ